MEFKDNYISTSAKILNDKSTKTVLSNDAYAIGEQLENLSIQIARSNQNK